MRFLSIVQDPVYIRKTQIQTWQVQKKYRNPFGNETIGTGRTLAHAEVTPNEE